MSIELSRGGFQNRDVGMSQFGTDFGPEYGVDFAQFAEATPGFEDSEGRSRMVLDEMLLSLARSVLRRLEGAEDVEAFVRNGFLFLQGPVMHQVSRDEIEKKMAGLPGVLKVINVLTVR